METLDKILSTIWLGLTLALFPLCALTGIMYYQEADYEFVNVMFNIICFISCFLFVGTFFNWIVVSIIKFIHRTIDKKKHPEKYKPVSNEQIARDFEELARQIRESEENEEHE